jgi:hypothetical protein
MLTRRKATLKMDMDSTPASRLREVLKHKDMENPTSHLPRIDFRLESLRRNPITTAFPVLQSLDSMVFLAFPPPMEDLPTVYQDRVRLPMSKPYLLIRLQFELA